MIKLKSFAKRYRLFLIMAAINLCLLAVSPELGKEAALSSFDSFLEMLSIIPPIFLLLGLMDVWVPKETIIKYMGRTQPDRDHPPCRHHG